MTEQTSNPGALREAVENILTVGQRMLDDAKNCGVSGEECPMQDAHKGRYNYTLSGAMKQLRAALSTESESRRALAEAVRIQCMTACEADRSNGSHHEETAQRILTVIKHLNLERLCDLTPIIGKPAVCVWTWNVITMMYDTGCGVESAAKGALRLCPVCGLTIQVKEADDELGSTS